MLGKKPGPGEVVDSPSCDWLGNDGQQAKSSFPVEPREPEVHQVSVVGQPGRTGSMLWFIAMTLIPPTLGLAMRSEGPWPLFADHIVTWSQVVIGFGVCATLIQVGVHWLRIKNLAWRPEGWLEQHKSTLLWLAAVWIMVVALPLMFLPDAFTVAP